MEWISGNYYLSEEEMQNNAKLVYSIMSHTHGWTLEAIAGMLGNMESESTINPGIWESLTISPEMGFGLVQWTPSTNYTAWANNLGADITAGDLQLWWIATETENYGQWIETEEFPVTFDDFTVSTLPPEYLALVFLRNFERAGIEVAQERQEQARKWYDYLSESGSDIEPPVEPPIEPIIPKKKKMPVWMMCRRWY